MSNSIYNGWRMEDVWLDDNSRHLKNSVRLPFLALSQHPIMQSTFSAAARVTGGRQGKWAWKARRCAKSELG
jgi:hypothetical protein